MKLSIASLLFSFYAFGFQAQITHFEGDIVLNGNKLNRSVTLSEGDKLEVNPPVDGIGDQFVSIGFDNGNRLIITGGEVTFAKLEAKYIELNSHKARAIASVETYDYKMSTKAMKFNTRHGSFVLYGGRFVLDESSSSAKAQTLWGKLRAISAWGSSDVYSEQQIDLHLKKTIRPTDMNSYQLQKLMLEFRKIGFSS